MSCFSDEISLIHDVEDKINQYGVILRKSFYLIESHLKEGKALPVELTQILAEDLPFDRSKFMRINGAIDSCIASNYSSLSIIRRELSEASISKAFLWMVNWSSNMGRCLEGVINEYQDSDILPPPHQHYSGMTQRIIDFLPPEKHQHFAHYLRTVENPWAKYATK